MDRRTESLCCRMIGVGFGAESTAGRGLAARATAGTPMEGASVSSTGLSGLWAVRGSFLKRPGYEAFRGVLAKLRIELPPARPVVVRTKSFSDQTLGECVRRPERFVIRLNAKMDQDTAIETLCYELGSPVGDERMAAKEVPIHLQHLHNRVGGPASVCLGVQLGLLRRVHMFQGSARASSALHASSAVTGGRWPAVGAATQVPLPCSPS